MAEHIISDFNYQQFINPQVAGELKVCGTIPRNWGMFAYGSLPYAKPFDLPLIPEGEIKNRVAAQLAAKARLSDIRNIGKFGTPIPAIDQNGRGYCATADTEVLTDRGWVLWPEYDWKKPPLLATVNQLTGRMEFQAPLQKHVYEYNGPMVYSTNRRLDFGVTPDHRMLVRKWDQRLGTLSSHYTFQRAGELGWYVGLMNAPRGFIGTDLTELTIEGDCSYDGDDLIALLSIICSCGYAGGSDSTRNWVSFCCFREDQRARYAALARRVGFSESPSRRGVWTRYDAGALAEWVRSNCYVGGGYHAPQKKIPDLVKWASPRQIKLFLSFFGDRDHSGQERYYSSSKRMIDDIQEILLRIGKRGTISDHESCQCVTKEGKVINSKESWSLNVGETDRLCLDRKKHIESGHYKGLVYCATVPNGTLITRRNGSVLISGNCWAHSGVTAHLLVRAVMNEPFADLSAYAIACIIKNYRDEGGWGYQGIEFQAERGCPTSEFWPQQGVNRSYDNPNTWANAALHKYTEWMDLDPNNMMQQLWTCQLLGIPVVSDFDWWSHSVCSVDIVDGATQFGITRDPWSGKLLELPEFDRTWDMNGPMMGYGNRIMNSWGPSWSENGMGVLVGSRARPNSAWAARVVTASAA